MLNHPVIRSASISTLLASLLLAGCGGDQPEALLASAKQYLAKQDNKAALIQLKTALQRSPDLAEARYLLGKTLLDNGDAVAAEVELSKAKALHYPDEALVPALARSWLMLGKGQKVIDELAATKLSLPAGQADLQVTLGQAYVQQGKPALADAAFKAALAAQPEYPPALLNQARMKAMQHDLPAALSQLDDLLAKAPGQYEAWQLKGNVLLAQGKPDAALDAYRKALQAKPDYLPAHSSIFNSYLGDDKLDDAAKQLAQMQKLAPQHPQTRYLQALLAYRQQQYPAARDTIQQVLKQAPENALALQLAGAIEFKLNSYPQAQAHLVRALAQAPELNTARRLLIMSYLRDGKPDKAQQVLQPVLDKMANDSNMQALAGTVYMQSGDVQKAGSYFARAAELDPGNPAKRTSLAMLKLAKGDASEAFLDLEKIAASDAGINADMALIASHLRRKEFDRALQAIAALEKKQAASPLVHNLRGTALLGKGDKPGARKSFERALALDSAYFPAIANLANLDLVEKKPADARKRFETLLAQDPKNTRGLLALAELAGRSGGSADEVASLLGRAIAASPTESAPRIALIRHHLHNKDAKKAVSVAQDALTALTDRADVLDAAGSAYQAAGDFNQALSTFSKLTALQPNDPQPYLRMADVQVAAGNKEAAIQSLRKALAVQPDLVAAQRGLIVLSLDAGKTDEALAIAREVQKQRPKEPLGYAMEGDIHARRKAWNEAVAIYRLGLKQAPQTDLAIRLHAVLALTTPAETDRFADSWLKAHAEDGKFRIYLAEAASQRRDYPTAIKHYRALLAMQPNNPAMMNNLAWALAQVHDPKALEYAEGAYKLAPDQPAVMDTLAGLLIDKGDTARALQLLRKAHELEPATAIFQFNLAKALIKAGQKAEARKELEALSKLGDKFQEQAAVGQLLKGLQ